MKKKIIFMLMSAALIWSLGACASREAAAEPDEEAPAATEAANVTAETLTAAEASGSESPYYGLIYATVIDIAGSGDSSTIYTFSDKADPDNGWSCPRYELLDVETDIEVGSDVVILFNGDIVGDYEDVSFLVVVPDGDYEIRRVEGVTTGNLMSTFSIVTDEGEELSFLKDNCVVDEGALSADSGDKVIVYFADGGEVGRFPLRVYKGQ